MIKVAFSVALAALCALPVRAEDAYVPYTHDLDQSLFGWTERPATAARTEGIARGPLPPKARAVAPATQFSSKSEEETKELEFGVHGEIWTGIVVAF